MKPKTSKLNKTKSFIGEAKKNLLYAVPFALATMMPSCKPEIIPDVDIVDPQIELYNPSNGQIYSTNKISLDYKVVEENFKEAYYTINGGEKTSLSKAGTKELDLPNGNYTLALEAYDISGNKDKETVSFIVDKETSDTTPPKIAFTSPEDNKTYSTGEIPFSWNITDESGVSSASYILNGTETPIDATGSTNFNLGNGNYELKVKATDTKTNAKDTTINFSVNIPQTYKYTINPFVQPNDSTLNWYGSGDVDGNNTLNSSDVSTLEKILSGEIVPNLDSDDPVEYRTLDRADVNGDGSVTQEDKQILQNRINGALTYMPGEWNKLQTKQEREAWLEKMLAIDKVDEIPGVPGEFVCDNFAQQLMINFHGFSELGYNSAEGLKDNGRFNIPMTDVNVTSTNFGHSINFTMTGDNLEEFSDGYYTEPQNDVNANNWLLNNFPDGCNVSIRGPLEKENYYLKTIAEVRIKDGEILSFDINPDPDLNIVRTREN